MTATARKILHEALQLPEEERSRIAEQLYDSVHGGTDPAIAKAWTDEAKRRLEEIRNGEDPGEDWEIVREELRAELRR